MSKGLNIKDEVVQSCIKDGQTAIATMTSSSLFTDSMAKAAGPNGPLEGTLRSVEESWKIRRDTMVETLEHLVQSIRDVSQGFQDLDDGLKDQVQPDSKTPVEKVRSSTQKEAGPVASGGGSPSLDPLASPPPMSGSGIPADSEPLFGPPSTEAPFEPDSLQSPDAFPPADFSDGTDEGNFFDNIGFIPEGGREAIEEFIKRWADLTGQHPQEVIALLAIWGGLVGGAVAGNTDSSSPDSGPISSAVEDALQPDHSGQDSPPDQPEEHLIMRNPALDERTRIEDGPGLKEGIRLGEGADSEPGTPESTGDDAQAVPDAVPEPERLKVDAEPAGLQPETTTTDAPLPGAPTPEDPFLHEGLQPSGGGSAAGGGPIDLPDLSSGAGAEPSSSSGGGDSGGISLPPLEEVAAESVTTSGSVSGPGLPNLRSSVPSTSGAPTTNLPDLQTDESSSRGVSGMVPMGGMRGGMAGGGLGTGGSSRGSLPKKDGSQRKRAGVDSAAATPETNNGNGEAS